MTWRRITTSGRSLVARTVGLIASAALTVSAAHSQTMIDSASDAADIAASDFWLVTLGDSYASGEGNPHWPIVNPLNSTKWLDDDKCHRSKHAWTQQVAAHYAGNDDYPNDVMHSFLACSGAGLGAGMLADYTSDWPALAPETHAPQLDRIEEQIDAAGRTPDAVLLSAGGNDVGFVNVVRDCLTGPCPGGRADADVVADNLDSLRGPDGTYAAVADRLDAMGIPASQVHLLVYPSPLEGRKRRILGGWGPRKILAACWLPSGKDAFRWAHEEVVEPLQAIQRDTAAREGWTLIDGHLGTFRRHSYCPRNGFAGADSWWVGAIPMLPRQYGFVGLFHPNKRGHDAIFREARDAVEDLVPVGWEFPEPSPELPEGARAWIGEYEGVYDGRPAELTIAPDETGGTLDVTLTEIDRNEVVSGFIPSTQLGEDEPGHVVENLDLTNGECHSWSDSPCVRKFIGRMLLHGWSDGRISGHSVWRGTDYGFAFSETGVEAERPAGGRLDASSPVADWTGQYDGSLDGRNARLTIERQGSALRITLEDLDRGGRFAGEVQASSVPDGGSHVLRDLELRSEDGGVKRIERLLLHTWDVNYLTSVQRWQGQPYGGFFARTGDS